MDLTLVRKWIDDNCTEGELSIDGSFFCYTLERSKEGKGCIPAGTYKVITDFSNRFQRIMPHVLTLDGQEVPGFTGIRIHKGNTVADTEGCILLAQERETDRIDNSALVFDPFFTKLQAALDAGQSVTLTIS